jgi:hypothetical protein
MNASATNPTTNILNSGITQIDVDNAIKKSGYPLQTIIANKLRKTFRCQEEWSFIDKDTNQLRTLDIMASTAMYDFSNDNQPRVRPELNLLIECKQAELPYVFFLSPDRLQSFSYPTISGLHSKDIKIVTDDDLSSWTLPILNVLELDENLFLTDSAPTSVTFSKCVRKGAEIELSGTDAYQSLILPLTKSLKHFDESQIPVKSAYYFDSHLTFAIGCIDAPMVGVTVNEFSHTSELIPWVRVFKHESSATGNWFERSKIYAIDIVHKDFFETYISNHVIPFAKKYSELVLKHGDIIADGKAFVKGMGANSWTNIENRLEKSSIFKRRIIPKI